MTALVRYEAARSALAAACSIDEVKDIRDKAEAMRAYARMANDTDLEADAGELRIRAERQLGILLSVEKRAGRLRPGPSRTSDINSESELIERRVSLADIGVDPKLSMRAQKIGGIAERAFEAAVVRARERIRAGGKASLDIGVDDKKERRAARERVLGEMQCALPDKRYGVILADPEWKFATWSDNGMDRAADNHYPTSTTEVIAARDVPSIAAASCVLFLWATVPMLPDALHVMTTWGFTYKSHFIWGKDKPGTGYWNRNTHEILLVGTRGNVPAPAMGTQWESLIAAPRGEHSAKPDKFLELIEHYFPTLPKIELNRRGPPRPGWDAWGNESLPPHDPTTGEILDPLPQDDATRPTREASSLGRPAPVMETAGAGTPIRSPIPEIDSFDLNSCGGRHE